MGNAKESTVTTIHAHIRLHTGVCHCLTSKLAILDRRATLKILQRLWPHWWDRVSMSILNAWIKLANSATYKWLTAARLTMRGKQHTDYLMKSYWFRRWELRNNEQNPPHDGHTNKHTDGECINKMPTIERFPTSAVGLIIAGRWQY
jgi:hypothetical protein